MTTILAIGSKPDAVSPLPSAFIRSQLPSGTEQTTTPAPAPVAVAPPPAVQSKDTVEKLEQMLQALDQVKQSIKPSLANSLEFLVDESTGKTVIKILDVETKTLIRQIPSEEMMAIAEAINRMEGRSGLVKEKV